MEEQERLPVVDDHFLPLALLEDADHKDPALRVPLHVERLQLLELRRYLPVTLVSPPPLWSTPETAEAAARNQELAMLPCLMTELLPPSGKRMGGLVGGNLRAESEGRGGRNSSEDYPQFKCSRKSGWPCQQGRRKEISSTFHLSESDERLSILLPTGKSGSSYLHCNF